MKRVFAAVVLASVCCFTGVDGSWRGAACGVARVGALAARYYEDVRLVCEVERRVWELQKQEQMSLRQAAHEKGCF